MDRFLFFVGLAWWVTASLPRLNIPPGDALIIGAIFISAGAIVRAIREAKP